MVADCLSRPKVNVVFSFAFIDLSAFAIAQAEDSEFQVCLKKRLLLEIAVALGRCFKTLYCWQRLYRPVSFSCSAYISRQGI